MLISSSWECEHRSAVSLVVSGFHLGGWYPLEWIVSGKLWKQTPTPLSFIPTTPSACFRLSSHSSTYSTQIARRWRTRWFHCLTFFPLITSEKSAGARPQRMQGIYSAADRHLKTSGEREWKWFTQGNSWQAWFQFPELPVVLVIYQIVSSVFLV